MSSSEDGLLRLGNGGFGTVMAASLHSMPVAVKRFNNQNVRVDLLEDLKREIRQFQALKVREARGGIFCWERGGVRGGGCVWEAGGRGGGG